MGKEKEEFSWLKAIKGPFDGKVWMKALIFGAIFLAEVFVIKAVVGQFSGQKPNHVIEEKIEANSGTITKSDSHDTVEKKSYSLLSLFDGWFK